MFRQRYTCVRLLGKGAYGAAYLVQDREEPSIQRAAKEIQLGHLSQKERQVALAESELLRKVSHPNIVAYVASYLEGSKLHIVMEYAERGDLDCKIKERRSANLWVRETSVLSVFVQLASALDHCHARKILHRDVKPRNIFLNKANEVKLGDFGIARTIDSWSAQVQTQIGTPLYLSPEICNHEPYGVKSDVWSLGVVIYELAALQVPFKSASLAAVAVMICSADPAPLPPRYSEELSHLLFALLEKDPLDRPSLGQVLHTSFLQQHMLRMPQHELLLPDARITEEQRPRTCRAAVAEAMWSARGSPPCSGVRAARPTDVEIAQRRRSAPMSSREHATRDEFFRNRNLAIAAKQRAEAWRYKPQQSPWDEDSDACGPGEYAEDRNVQWKEQEDEDDRLEQLQRARIEAQRDRRRVRELVREREAETESQGPPSSRQVVECQYSDAMPSVRSRAVSEQERCARRRASEDARLEELERARIEALQHRRSIEERAKQRSTEAVKPESLDEETIDPRESNVMQGGDGSAGSGRERAASKQEDQDAKWKELERARLEAQRDRRMIRERIRERKAEDEVHDSAAIVAPTIQCNVAVEDYTFGPAICTREPSSSSPRSSKKDRGEQDERLKLQELEEARRAAKADQRWALQRVQKRQAEAGTTDEEPCAAPEAAQQVASGEWPVLPSSSVLVDQKDVPAPALPPHNPCGYSTPEPEVDSSPLALPSPPHHSQSSPGLGHVGHGQWPRSASFGHIAAAPEPVPMQWDEAGLRQPVHCWNDDCWQPDFPAPTEPPRLAARRASAAAFAVAIAMDRTKEDEAVQKAAHRAMAAAMGVAAAAESLAPLST